MNPAPPRDSASFSVATHDGGFHADDAVACAVISAIFPGISIVRTRDPQVISAARFAVDVGGVHEPSSGRFDHHQNGFDLSRPCGTPYAAAGLVWSAMGEAFVSMACDAAGVGSPTPGEAAIVAGVVDQQLVRHIDAEDSGHARPAPGWFGLSAVVDSLVPSWREMPSDPSGRAEILLDGFLSAVRLCGVALTRACVSAFASVRARDVCSSAPSVADGRVVVLPSPGLPWRETIGSDRPEALFCVYPDSSGSQWQVAVVPVSPESFEARLDLPLAWAGLRGDELAAVSGVPDSVFCHKGLFCCGASSRDGAILMAVKACGY